MIEIIIILLLGIAAGTITGLIPGLHINLVATFLLTLSSYLIIYFSPLSLAIFIIAMSITHTFVDFVPSIFLGAPDEDTSLSILPGHKMLLDGRGYEAVELTLIGSFMALFIILLITPLFIFFLPKVYPIIQKNMFWILMLLSSFLIMKEKNLFWTFFLFLLSGILGIASLNFHLIKQPLFPLFSGLFGLSLLSMSIMEKVRIPKQKITKAEIKNSEKIKAFFACLISTPLCSFLPGLGSSQAAVLSMAFFKKINEKTFLIMIGAINTIVMGLSFVALYSIGKMRTGSAAIVNKLIGEFGLNDLILILGVIFISGIISYFLTLFAAKFFVKNICKIKYSRICLIIVVLIFTATIFISGFYGLIVLITGTSVGILATVKKVKKMFLMGSLMIPVIFYYL